MTKGIYLPKTYNYLYQITNTINHKIYVGCHSTNDLDDGYMGSGTYINRAYQKYGQENFIKTILGFYPDAASMFAAEQDMVTPEFIKESTNYNGSVGGRGGMKSEEIYKSSIRSAKIGAYSKGKASMKTPDGTVVKIDIDDDRIDTKELVGITKGKSVVKDSSGKIFQVDSDDPRIQTGELVGVTKGFAVMKDSDGKRYHVPKDDPRIITGELKGNTSGSVQTAESNAKRRAALLGKSKPQPYVTCNGCGKSTSRTNIIRWHKDCIASEGLTSV
jgi:hypothetical protein